MANENKPEEGPNVADDGGAADYADNPIIEALRGKRETKPTVIDGYAGPADPPDPSKVHIYSSLVDLTTWHTVLRTDILFRVSPKNPLLPTTFFLKSTAVAAHHQPVNATAQAKFIGGSLLARHFDAAQAAAAPFGITIPNVSVACPTTWQPTKTNPTTPCAVYTTGLTPLVTPVLFDGGPPHYTNLVTGPCK